MGRQRVSSPGCSPLQCCSEHLVSVTHCEIQAITTQAGWQKRHTGHIIACKRSLRSQSLYLVFIRPEGADSQLNLVPLLGVRPRRVPHRTAERAAVDSHIRPQGPWTVAVPTVEEVAELDAVCVVFAQRLQQQLSTMAHGVLGGVHQHI